MFQAGKNREQVCRVTAVADIANTTKIVNQLRHYKQKKQAHGLYFS